MTGNDERESDLNRPPQPTVSADFDARYGSDPSTPWSALTPLAYHAPPAVARAGRRGAWDQGQDDNHSIYARRQFPV